LEDLDIDGRIMLMNLKDIVREGLDLIRIRIRRSGRSLWTRALLFVIYKMQVLFSLAERL
jgi:hypothetical protein